MVYYQGETHYFVFTASRESLVARGVIKEDREKVEELLARDNVDREALHEYAKEVR